MSIIMLPILLLPLVAFYFTVYVKTKAKLKSLIVAIIEFAVGWICIFLLQKLLPDDLGMVVIALIYLAIIYIIIIILNLIIFKKNK